MADTNMAFNLQDLATELQDMVWLSSAGLDGQPAMQCLEVDFLDGLGNAANWFEPPHVPTAYIPTRCYGGAGTANSSQYLTVRDVAQASTGARDAIEHFRRAEQLKNPDDLVEIKVKAKRQPRYMRYMLPAEPGEVSVWLHPKRDVLCLQSPSQLSHRHLPKGTQEVWFTTRGSDLGTVHCNWFSPDTGGYPLRFDLYRPLPFFGLEKMERVAIDFQCEKARHAFDWVCVDHACRRFRLAYHVQLYHTPAEERKYCVSCLETYLNNLNQAIQDKRFDQNEFECHMDDEFPLDGDDWLSEQPRGLSEPGTFTCQSCKGQFPCNNGRIGKVSNYTYPFNHDPWPFDITQYAGWQPTCLPWHQPYMETDIDTFLMGRLPSLKTFYVIDTTIKLKPGRKPTLPAEQFAGHKCRFVEVNTHDDAWDIDTARWPPYNKESNPCPLNSFAFAQELQCMAWDHSCRQQVKASIDEESDDDDDEDDADHDIGVGWENAGSEAQKSSVQDKQPLDDPIYPSWKLRKVLPQIQMPNMAPSTTLQPSWPDGLLPVRVKVMTRIDDDGSLCESALTSGAKEEDFVFSLR